MTSLPSLSRSIRSRITLPLMWAVVPFMMTLACADKHIGRPCVIGLPADPNMANIASVNPQALECPSRICLLPSQDITLDTGKTPTGPLCTDYCSSDDDCSDAETRGSDKTSTRCIGGFVCRTPIGNIEGNPVSCKRLCLCQDFLKPKEPDTTPVGCKQQ